MLLKSHLVPLIGLVILWCLLSGHYHWLLLFLGALSCLVSYGFYQKIVGQTKIAKLKVHPIKQVRYTFWLIGQIIVAGIAVIGAIFNTKKLAPQFFDVDASGLDELGRVMYANSITRTPGTVSIDVSETKIQVHGLLANSKADLMNDKMLVKVRQLAKHQ